MDILTFHQYYSSCFSFKEQACAEPTPEFSNKTEIKESMCLYSLNPTVIIKEENIFIKTDPLDCNEMDPLNDQNLPLK